MNKLIVLYRIENKEVLHASTDILDIKNAMVNHYIEIKSKYPTIFELSKIANKYNLDVATTKINF